MAATLTLHQAVKFAQWLFVAGTGPYEPREGLVTLAVFHQVTIHLSSLVKTMLDDSLTD